MQEVWKDIKGYESFYQVSNLGNIKSLPRQFMRSNGKLQTFESKILKPLVHKNGYCKVELAYKGLHKRYYVHRLVAEAFIPNSDNLPEINHKDENPSNNCVNNLEWCTHKYNSNYGTRPKRIGGKHSKKVIMYDKNNNIIRIFNSVAEASKLTGIHAGSISECCNGKQYRHSAGGYIWRYE